RHVIIHLRGCFAAMGVPIQLKTDNAPAYLSRTLHQFLNHWGITHVTGIPHSPTGQAIIDRTHQT
ncbi:POK8 protein, partial [Probosciger aterrimus]|nr:POK8 protein [Probosciger aterrimus]